MISIRCDKKVLESENPVITVEDVFIFDKKDDVTPAVESHLYLKYDIEDNTNPDIVHHFPFGEKSLCDRCNRN